MKRKSYSLDDEILIIERGATPDGFRLFRKAVYGYYRESGRDLPWRRTRNPYRILVSEVMLQQTQVERVIEKFGQFIEAFPDFAALAGATFKDVFTVWQGLGYNRRAAAIRKIAERVVSEYGGEMPRRLEDLMTLPGIGHATAASIVTFAFNEPAVFIETNIRRVFIHFFFRDRESVRDADIMPLVEKTLDRKNPRDWYYALMDYGAVLKKHVPNPNRRSAHHQRQPPFENSSRQLRGRVLKLLLDTPAATEKEISLLLEVEHEIVKRCLRKLMKEGFIVKSGRRFAIV